jgi:hypothetical protein
VSHIDPAQTSSPRIIHVTMFHQDEDQTKVYQLFLNEPIVLEE